jgi:hypothetical protein
VRSQGMFEVEKLKQRGLENVYTIRTCVHTRELIATTVWFQNVR